MPWSCGVVRGGGNQTSEDGVGGKMACPKITKGLEVILGFRIMLQMLHSKLCMNRGTTPSADSFNFGKGEEEEKLHYQ